MTTNVTAERMMEEKTMDERNKSMDGKMMERKMEGKMMMGGKMAMGGMMDEEMVQRMKEKMMERMMERMMEDEMMMRSKRITITAYLSPPQPFVISTQTTVEQLEKLIRSEFMVSIPSPLCSHLHKINLISFALFLHLFIYTFLMFIFLTVGTGH